LDSSGSTLNQLPHEKRARQRGTQGQGPYHRLRTGSSSSPPNTQIHHLPPTPAICPARDVFRVEGDTRWGLVEQAGDAFPARSRSVSPCHSSPISYGLHWISASRRQRNGFGGVCVIVVVIDVHLDAWGFFLVLFCVFPSLRCCSSFPSDAARPALAVT
jgi:hypothetical protein